VHYQSARFPKARPIHANGRLGARHNTGAIFTFADGHTRWLKQPPDDCSNWFPDSTRGSIQNLTPLGCQ
jgi:prepilin-type processing-associated H-X9-DG protein